MPIGISCWFVIDKKEGKTVGMYESSWNWLYNSSACINIWWVLFCAPFSSGSLCSASMISAGFVLRNGRNTAPLPEDTIAARATRSSNMWRDSPRRWLWRYSHLKLASTHGSQAIQVMHLLHIYFPGSYFSCVKSNKTGSVLLFRVYMLLWAWISIMKLLLLLWLCPRRQKKSTRVFRNLTVLCIIIHDARIMNTVTRWEYFCNECLKNVPVEWLTHYLLTVIRQTCFFYIS